jgi:hypothetical protein
LWFNLRIGSKAVGVYVDIEARHTANEPIFVGGAGRSGTTLLVDLIGGHSEISPVYETDFVQNVIYMLIGRSQLPLAQKLSRLEAYLQSWGEQIENKPHNKGANERFVHGPHYLRFTESQFSVASTDLLSAVARGVEPTDALANMITSLFSSHAIADDKKVWVNKTPANLSIAPELHQMFPRMKFLHCVRDPRDVACSVVDRPWGPQTHEQAGEWWRGKVARGLQWGRSGAGDYMEVSYEALLLKPAAVLDSVFEWLGYPLEGATVVGERIAQGISFDCSRIERWRQDFPKSQYSAFFSACGAEMNSVGYTQW